MSRAIAASIALAVGVALVATGCVGTRVVPPGPTGDELDTAVDSRLDQAWYNTGLDGLVERPDVELAEPTDDEDGFLRLADCLGSRGYAGFGMSDGPQGPELQTIDGTELTVQMRLDFFTCFAEAPTIFDAGTPMLAPAQLDYLYDYYRDWVIPCLETAGVHVDTVPPRGEYLANPYGSWTPYEAVMQNAALDYDGAVELCGDPHDGLLPARAPGGFSITSLQN